MIQWRVRGVLPFLFFLVAPATASAQAVLKGLVRQDSSGIPLAEVEVIAEGAGRQTTSDRSGRFLLRDLPYGPQTILLRKIGFRPARRGVVLLRRDTARLDVLLISEAAQRLEPIAVEGRAERPEPGIRQEFEERRRLGFGTFIDSTFLRANEHRRVPDLLRSIAGIRIVRTQACGQASCGPLGLYAQGTRGNPVRFTLGRGTMPCWASVVVDGQVKYQDGASLSPPPELESEFSISELHAIEVYRSSAEYPAEFSGIVGSCGLIVFWTRMGR